MTVGNDGLLKVTFGLISEVTRRVKGVTVTLFKEKKPQIYLLFHFLPSKSRKADNTLIFISWAWPTKTPILQFVVSLPLKTVLYDYY